VRADYHYITQVVCPIEREPEQRSHESRRRASRKRQQSEH
jgi:hypothetical protein